MSKYRDAILTNQGLDFVRKAVNGKIEITFTKGIMSAEDHSKDSDQTIQGLTSLNGFVQSNPINYTMPVDDENVSVPLRFENESMTENNYIDTIGIYASDGTNEILHSVIINDDPELFSAYNGKTPESVKINSTTQVGRASQVSAQISPLGMVTEEEFQKLREMGQLSSNDDILQIKDNGHYVINGTNPANNPWGKDIWADVYKTTYNIVMRDNLGAEFIRSNYDNTWKRTLNSIDQQTMQSSMTSIADSLGDWNRTGFDSLGGSVSWLKAENNNRISDIQNLSTQARSESQYNEVAQLTDNDDLLGLSQNGHYVINGTNPANNPWGKDIWADVYKTTYNIVMRDNLGAEFIRSNYDNTWKRTLNSIDQNNLQTQINAVSSKAQYNVVAYLQDGDDVFNLPQNGHYVIGGTNPKNNPWGKQIWADIYKNDMSLIVYDNIGGCSIKTPNGWRSV